MKRLLTSAAAAAVMLAGSGSGAQAQGAASLFDLAVYGGIGYDYNWLTNLISAGQRSDRLSPGFAPGVGASATFWAADAFGVRSNVWYQDTDLPEGARPQIVNSWFYDLSLVMRPWVARTEGSRLLSSLYVFVGGGGFTANPPGSGLGCVEPYAQAAGACLAVDWEKSTVGQGTAGFGWDVFNLTDNIGLFTELAGYVYDSPFHTGRGWTGRTVAGAEDRDTYGMTGRFTAGLKFSFGERSPVVVAPPLPPPPPPAPPAAPPAPPPPPAMRDISVCVVTNTGLQTVTATFNPANNDTTVAGGTRFSTQYPATAPTYAAGATWFINTDAIRLNNSEFVKFGVSRLISNAGQLQRVGEFQGTPIFAEMGATRPYQVLYVPLRPGCEFQPYSPRPRVRG